MYITKETALKGIRVSNVKINKCIFADQRSDTICTDNICLYREWNYLEYGNIAGLHAFKGTRTVWSKVTLQRYMFLRDWNCLHYGNMAKIHICTRPATVCSTVKLQIYMFVKGLELSAVV